MTNKIYTLPEGKNVNEMAHAIQMYLMNSESMNVQILTTEAGQYIIQARAQNGKVGQWFGLDKAIQVTITPCGNNVVTVTIGNGEWLKKSLTMATSMVVLWPLAVTSTVGMVKQGKLPGKIDHTIQMYLAGLTAPVAGGLIPCAAAC